ncbi:hypothetical protein AAC387_Pa02g2515 [Persea americana]
MSSVKDLVEEAKKRIVLLLVCVFGLSYLMSLTSSSVWVNLPAAAFLIILLRYVSIDLDTRRRGAAYNKPASASNLSQKKSLDGPNIDQENLNWRTKVDSPVVETAIDQFTRHLVSEWVTDLWYSRLTPDMDGPEELVQIMNGVLGEISYRVRDINLIDLLTRDIVNVICSNLELYRSCRSKIGNYEPGRLPAGYHDAQLKIVLASEKKLHPALFSAAAEHKVLQHLMGGLISFTFKPQDLQCSFFRYTVRELLARAVMRPVLNLANPRFINERIESLVLSVTKKTDKGISPSAPDASQIKQPKRTSSDSFSAFRDPSNKGVELVQLTHDHSEIRSGEPMKNISNGSASTILESSHQPRVGPVNHKLHPTKMNPLSSDSQSLHPRGSLPSDSQIDDGKNVLAPRPVGEWGQMLDYISHRKTQALAPEHFENMWTKGRNYKKKEGANESVKQVVQNSQVGSSQTMAHLKVSSKHNIIDGTVKADVSARSNVYPQHRDPLVVGNSHSYIDGNISGRNPGTSYQEKAEHDLMPLEEDESVQSESSYESEEDENSNVTGLDSPGTKVWDSKNNRNAAVSHIRHPLENSEGNLMRKSGKGPIRYRRLSKTQSGRKRSRPSRQKAHVWQEVERTTFLSGDGQDILNDSKCDTKAEDSSDDFDLETWGRVHSGAAASSSAPSISLSDPCNSSIKSYGNNVLADSFLKLRCEVLGANVVKSGSRTFAVYSISVTDANNNSWSIKRRFRHFEELHRRLKEFPQYNLSLPPKHFLSSGLDVSVVQERCKLLDTYLKKLLQIPTVSGSIEVWDFLSVDSQTYVFSNSLSIIETLSDDKPYERSPKIQSSMMAINEQSFSQGEHFGIKSKETALQMKQNCVLDDLKLTKQGTKHFAKKNVGKESENLVEDHSGSDSDGRQKMNASSFIKSAKPLKVAEGGPDGTEDTSRLLTDAASDPMLPNEWVPPNLSVPLLDLVDVIFQLQDGGWIRRQAFWIAKQILQLGMGDAFDDWLIEKIQLLRKGSVIASIIERVEQILWPDGIFITKHPKRQRPPPSRSQSQNSPGGQLASSKMEVERRSEKVDNLLTNEQEQEAIRRANFVRELMIDNAPAALVGLVGRKEYERSAKDIYFFLQSPVCLKQLAFDLLELLLLSAFPELDDVVKQCHDEMDHFGEFETN